MALGDPRQRRRRTVPRAGRGGSRRPACAARHGRVWNPRAGVGAVRHRRVARLAELEPHLRGTLPRAALHRLRSIAGALPAVRCTHRGMDRQSHLASGGARLAGTKRRREATGGRRGFAIAAPIPASGVRGLRTRGRRRMGARESPIGSRFSRLDLRSRFASAAGSGVRRVRCGTGAAPVFAGRGRVRGALCRRRRHTAGGLCAGAGRLEHAVGRHGPGVLRKIQRAAAHARAAGIGRRGRRRGGARYCASPTRPERSRPR